MAENFPGLESDIYLQIQAKLIPNTINLKISTPRHSQWNCWKLKTKKKKIFKTAREKSHITYHCRFLIRNLGYQKKEENIFNMLKEMSTHKATNKENTSQK